MDSDNIEILIKDGLFIDISKYIAFPVLLFYNYVDQICIIMRKANLKWIIPYINMPRKLL